MKVAFSTSLALRVYLILEAVSNPGGKGSLNIRAKDMQVARWPLPLSEVSSYFFGPYLPLGVGAMDSMSSNLQLQEEVPTGLASLTPPPPPVWAEGFLSLVIIVNKIC